MGTIIIIKLIFLIFIEEKNQLIAKTNVEGIISRYNGKKEFERKLRYRRLIGKIVIILISLFLFYYVTIFCNSYRKTQINWFIGGVWCLLIEWIILAPILILMISIIQKNKEEPTYYLNRLFCV